eukprot:scaffold19800_cov58-Cyclotella_meneghiniana.AAC.2
MVSNPFWKWGVVVVVFFESLLPLRTGIVRRLTVAAVDSLSAARFSFLWSCCFVPVGVRVLLLKPSDQQASPSGIVGSGHGRRR